MLGSSDLLLIDSYDTLNQSHACSNSRIWRNLFWKQKKIMAAQPPPMPHIYMRVVSMIPHSYLVHFELVQPHCLSSLLCTFLTLTIHVHDFTHYLSQSIIQRLITPLKQKENKWSESSYSWILVQKKNRGEDDKSESIMTNKCCCLHMHMVRVFEWHCYLETLCLNLQNKWKKISIYLCYHTK